MTKEATPRTEPPEKTVLGIQRWSTLSQVRRIQLVIGSLAILAIPVWLTALSMRSAQIEPPAPPAVSTVGGGPTVDQNPDRNVGSDNNASTLTIAPEFEPANGELSNCVGSFAERPGCGAEGRGGWRQSLVFFVLLGGLAFIAWRVYVGAKKQQRLRQRTGHRA